MSMVTLVTFSNPHNTVCNKKNCTQWKPAEAMNTNNKTEQLVWRHRDLTSNGDVNTVSSKNIRYKRVSYHEYGRS